MNRMERDNFQTWVGYTESDIQIWGQYENLVDFIYEEFPKTNRRFDEISFPTLFVLSHGVEVALKENLKFFLKYHESNHLSKFDSWANLLRSHDLQKLSLEFKSSYLKLHKKVKADDRDKEEFNTYFQSLQELILILNRGSETYRYSTKLNKSGHVIKRSVERTKKIDFLVVKDLYDKAKTFFVGAPNSMGHYTDYIDFKRGNPDYDKGKGYLFCQRLPFSEHFLKKVENTLSEQLTHLHNGTWMNSETGENFELQVWNNDIYIIAI